MLTSAALGLLALLRRIRSIGNNLKPFVLRCPLFWPHLLRSLRRIWPLCPGTDLKNAPKKKGDQARPSFPAASGVCEGYNTIHASLDPNRSSVPHLPLESRSARDLNVLVSPDAGQSQSASHTGSPVSEPPIGPPSPSSTHPFKRHFPGGGASPMANSDGIPLPQTIPLLAAPLTLTHSRITSMQFAGAPRRPRPQSRPPSPLLSSLPLPQSTPVGSPAASLRPSPSPSPLPSPSLLTWPQSRPPSPLPSSHPLPQSTPVGSPAASPRPSRSPSPLSSPLLLPQPDPLPHSSVPDSPGSTHISDVEPTHDISEGHRRPDIMIYPPSRSQTTEAKSQSINFPLSPLSIHLDPSDTGSLEQVNPRYSRESLRPNSPALSPNRAHPIHLPYSTRSQVTLENVPYPDASMNWSDGKKRSIGLMHSEQVSRYVNQGDVCVHPAIY
jgi:hypothetical protein